MTAITKITPKGQTTIAQDIRAALHVGAGDLTAWEMIDDGTDRVLRVQPLDIEYLRAVDGTLSEWAGKFDEEAYRDLLSDLPW